MGNILRIGLTGGIGSGKSTACMIFAELGVPVIDADEIAHRLSAKGQPAYFAITRLFDDKIIRTDGELDRAKLRKIVFEDDDARHKVEGILHPLIYNEIDKQVSQLENNYCIICIPLLIETGATGKVDRILVIDATEEQQILRASKRDNINYKIIINIIRAQASRRDRLSIAHDIIYNDGDIESLRCQIHKLNEKYKIASKKEENI
jgi:dephospho-CoA kinase